MLENYSVFHCVIPGYIAIVIIVSDEHSHVCFIMLLSVNIWVLICVSRPSVSEEEIKEAFTKNGFPVKAFKFFP
jgi:hypothetical protein